MRTVLAFPSTYSVGITSLGYQVVWATLAQRADVDVRRLFTDQADPPHRRLDLFGLSLSWELDGPVLLDLLEQQRIPIWASERGDSDPIVFGGGPVLTANPEPLAPFFDVVLLGDGELLLPAFIDALQAGRDAPRPGTRLRDASTAHAEATSTCTRPAPSSCTPVTTPRNTSASEASATALSANPDGRVDAK